jgi:hypothetical protein
VHGGAENSEQIGAEKVLLGLLHLCADLGAENCTRISETILVRFNL